MRPARQTPAHKTGGLAELVCSNSLKSEQENAAPWLLKEELRRLGSLLIDVAARTRVPAGHALTVDRDLFSAEITRMIETEPGIELRREEVISLDPAKLWIVATGPLTSDLFAQEIARITGAERLFFYDSISPIVEADSVDTAIAFRASRYGKSLDGTDDYLNCPFDRSNTRLSSTRCWPQAPCPRTSRKTIPATSKPACRSRKSLAVDGIPCVSGP